MAQMQAHEVRQESLLAEFVTAKHEGQSLKSELFEMKEDQVCRERASQGPTGQVTLIFTDIQGSTRLWEKLKDTMSEVLEIHHGIMRSVIAKYDGFEVKTEGDAFMVAFGDPISAIKWTVEVQRQLFAANWPKAVYSDPDGAIEDNYWKGVRVRMGGDCGRPDCQQDPVTGRTDYYGPMVNMSARVCGTARGVSPVFSAEHGTHLSF
eukprot:NODE_437_length_2087_cov_12.432777_g301_i1.p2 GENE.NODE_437_length_2087_cov_12.432777_g301_i1~~NODE_437_length_2087_cov_12.432777_g301_i1.p2  ORF type:complete len:207 (+),score=48.32 NODE_437_length_2087_cov_12.432777_g301_i1:408-1028(+)